jgi:hypothetical protein
MDNELIKRIRKLGQQYAPRWTNFHSFKVGHLSGLTPGYTRDLQKEPSGRTRTVALSDFGSSDVARVLGGQKSLNSHLAQ